MFYVLIIMGFLGGDLTVLLHDPAIKFKTERQCVATAEAKQAYYRAKNPQVTIDWKCIPFPYHEGS